MDDLDVIVVGGGHAGVEASLAAARLGCRTALYTMSIEQIAKMPCNPSIGGTAKGHLVREIDALGGEMGIAADQSFIQSRMLNRGKGPAVHSLRAQVDRADYQKAVRTSVEREEKIFLYQDEVVALQREKGRICGVVGRLYGAVSARAVVLCCGTYLGGTIYVGEVFYSGGPDYTLAPQLLAKQLVEWGLPLRRFKTGTPARIHKRSIDFSKLTVQQGDDPVVPFSFTTTRPLQNRAVCHIAYTNLETHRVIRENLKRSPLFQGRIEGEGPRYCPSIEDKVVRFADKERHQIFVEPMGLQSSEIYLQGMSSSLPVEVQRDFIHTIVGFEKAEMIRPGYAIEYDCCDPLCLRPTLEVKKVPGLFGAGQFNGTSGYEEAAAQGLVAGINAALYSRGEEGIEWSRENSYIGTLIDDLVTKGCTDPYRMMTSRSEYRLLLRQDNADQRLTPLGYRLGLIGEERYRNFQEKERLLQQELQRMEKQILHPSEELNNYLVSRGTTEISEPVRLVELVRRPQLRYLELAPFDINRTELPSAITEQAEIVVRYAGYIQKQKKRVERMKEFEQTRLPLHVDYQGVEGLRLEAREKLNQVRPTHMGQAARIPGVNPADLTVLQVWLAKRGREEWR